VLEKVRRWFSRRIPLFYRLLIANSIVLILWAVFGTWLVVHAVSNGHLSPHLYAVMVGGGIVASTALNFLVLKLALHPLGEIQRVIQRVETGDMSARVDANQIGDRDLARFSLLFNEMLDRLEENADTIRQDREQLRRMALAVLNAQEEERRRLARELHDQTSQALSIMLVGIDTGLKEMPPRVSEGHQQLLFLKKVATQTLEELRALSRNLHPTVLDDLGLLPAVRWYARNTLEKAGIHVTIDARGLDERLPSEIETAVFRIVQESLSNVLRHAEAKEATVRLVKADGELAVEVSDDGKGFDVNKVRSSRTHNLGLVGMEERATLLGGSFQIESGEGRGTRISVRIPLKWDEDGKDQDSPG
jgi:two-component system sensor histidine kinase UhpB